jgi:hypothetical protein
MRRRVVDGEDAANRDAGGDLYDRSQCYIRLDHTHDEPDTSGELDRNAVPLQLCVVDDNSTNARTAEDVDNC